MQEPTEKRLTPEEIKARISFPQLIDYYGYRPEKDKIICPFHHEHTASFHVYEDGGKCYGGCGWHGDVIQFVMDRESCYFGKALELLCSWFGIDKNTPPQQATKAKDVPAKLRRDPVNPEIVSYFHSNLTEDRRIWLHEKRLLTDETINYLKLGWRPDLEGYSIPFWKGIPGLSEVDIMQFRYAPKEGRKSRYISLDSHGFAGLIGRQTINPEFLVVFVGTLDCVLANQDGIPAVSPNGLTVWKNRLEELKWIIGPVKQLYFVPDNTSSETVESVRLANALGAQIRYLPQMETGKDYTDFRLLGNTPKQFIEGVLRVSSGPFITNEEHVKAVRDVLDLMAQGDEKALEILDILFLNEYAWYSIDHKLMLIASMHPHAGMNGREWEAFIYKLELAHSHEAITQAVKDTISIVNSKGGF